LSLSLLATLAASAWAGQICCPNTGCFNDNYPFNHLPLPRCENTINPEYLVFTRNNRNSPQYMTRSSVPSVLSTSRKTIFLIHGYTNDKNTNWMHNMKNALLDKGSYNVVIVGWGGGSQELYYPRAASNTRVVGAETAAVAQNLLNRGSSRGNLMCIGHSLGAHTCGFAGKRTKWGRISGLDPAGPMFENYPNGARLQPGDANLVDAIHTMGKEGFILDLGTLVPLGHIDFYPNGGGIQPGCSNREMDQYGDIIGCSHSRAVAFYEESIGNACFRVRQRCTNERDLPGSCSSCGDCQNMGFDADRYSGRGKFYLTTNANSRYCRG